jgi:hypothetical protein
MYKKYSQQAKFADSVLKVKLHASDTNLVSPVRHANLLDWTCLWTCSNMSPIRRPMPKWEDNIRMDLR